MATTIGDRIIVVTAGEALWLTRRRAGLTQPELARARGICTDTLQLEESDQRPRMQIKHTQMTVSPGEWCALQRRRRGWTMPVAAKHIGISRMTLWKAEHDKTRGVARVQRWYELRGIREIEEVA
jgi:DNA-binding XRE family transcriptional regulator